MAVILILYYKNMIYFGCKFWCIHTPTLTPTELGVSMLDPLKARMRVFHLCSIFIMHERKYSYSHTRTYVKIRIK